MNQNLPSERLNISVQSAGPNEINRLLKIISGLDQAIEMTGQESITLDKYGLMIILWSVDIAGKVNCWRKICRTTSREAIVEAIIATKRKDDRTLLENIMRIRAARDHKTPPAWHYTAQPLLKRLIIISGYEPAQFLKASGLKPGNVQNLSVKPKGNGYRTIKAKTFLSITGRITDDTFKLENIQLGEGNYIQWMGGIDQNYDIRLQSPLPLTIQQSIIGKPAASLVDDERTKALLADMTIVEVRPASQGRHIKLSAQPFEQLQDQPPWVEEEQERLINRLTHWASQSV